MITLPPSKSIGARFLVASFFAGTLPADPLFEDNDDLMLLQQALLEIYSDEEPIDFGDTPLDVGASGTALRFISAVCASVPGADYVVTGTERLMERPMKALLNILQEAGAEVEALGKDQRGPYRIKGNVIEGGDFLIPGDISSQFISAIMLVAPSWEKGVHLTFSTIPVSLPYIEMTTRMLRNFGIKADFSENDANVERGTYKIPEDYKVEADWSAAAFFYEAASFGAADVVIEGLPAPENSLQGDAVAQDLFARLGIISSYNSNGVSLELGSRKAEKIDADLRNCPDLMLPFALACACNGVKFRFTGIAHLRLKESDRIEALKNESLKLGFVMKTGDDSIEWNGEKTQPQENPLINTYEDHRVAMAFAMTALKYGKIRIENPQVVEKSFIDFWNQIQNIGLKCVETDNVMIVEK